MSGMTTEEKLEILADALRQYADIGKWEYASEEQRYATQFFPLDGRHGWILAKTALVEAGVKEAK